MNRISQKPEVYATGTNFSSSRSLDQVAPWFLYIAFVTLYAVYFGLWPAEPLSGEVSFYNVILVALSVFPLFYWKLKGGLTIPMFELICVAYGVKFGLMAQLLPNEIVIWGEKYTIDDQYLSQASLFSVFGVLFTILGYYLAQRIFIKWTFNSIDLPLNGKRIYYYLIAAPVLSILFLIIGSVSTQLQAIVGLLSGQLYLSIVLVSYYFYDKRTSDRIIKVIFYFSLFVGLVLGLSSGFLEKAFVPLVLVTIVRWQKIRKFPWFATIVLICVMVLLNSVKKDYRSQTWYGDKGDFATRITLWWDLATKNVTDLVSGGDEQGDTTDEVSETFFRRLDVIHKFAWVVKKTPESIPYYQGSTYSYLLYGWIPRFIWPDKPSASADSAYRLDQDYKLVGKNRIGKVNIGIGGFLPEAYVNFGVWGIVFIMAIQGAFFAFLDRLLNSPYSQGGRAIYLAIMVFFLNGMSSSTVTLFGAILQIVFANVLILRLFSLGWSASSLRKNKSISS